MGRPPPGPGIRRIGCFDIREVSLPEVAQTVPDLEGRILQLRKESADFYEMTEQQAIRMLMGCDLDLKISLERACDVSQWRKANSLEQIRAKLSAQLVPSAASRPVKLP